MLKVILSTHTIICLLKNENAFLFLLLEPFLLAILTIKKLFEFYIFIWSNKYLYNNKNCQDYV